MVVDHVEDGVNHRRGEATAVGVANVTILQMEAARPKDLGCEVELPVPVGHDLPPKEALRPRVHLRCHNLGRLQKDRVLRECQAKVSLVVKRHRLDLTQGVFAIEHPSVGAGEKGVRNVADAVFQRRVRLGAGTGALHPLALQIVGNRGAGEPPGAGVGDLDRSPRDGGFRVEKLDPFALLRAAAAAFQSGLHHGLAITVERGQLGENRKGSRRQHVGVAVLHPRPDLERVGCLHHDHTDYEKTPFGCWRVRP